MQVAVAEPQERRDSRVPNNSHTLDHSWLITRIFLTLSSIKLLLFIKLYYILVIIFLLEVCAYSEFPRYTKRLNIL